MEPKTYPLAMTVNNRKVAVEIKADELLVDVLRDRLGLIGTKIGCNEGECGACTIIMDSKPVLSCLIPALRAQGREILTIEGLSDGDTLHPLQQAFVDHCFAGSFHHVPAPDAQYFLSGYTLHY